MVTTIKGWQQQSHVRIDPNTQQLQAWRIREHFLGMDVATPTIGWGLNWFGVILLIIAVIAVFCWGLYHG